MESPKEPLSTSSVHSPLSQCICRIILFFQTRRHSYTYKFGTFGGLGFHFSTLWYRCAHMEHWVSAYYALCSKFDLRLVYIYCKACKSINRLFESQWHRTDTSALRSCLHEGGAFRERTARQITLRRQAPITRLQVSPDSVQYGSQ